MYKVENDKKKRVNYFMALYLYYAADKIYMGLHDMEFFDIINEPNLGNAFKKAKAASREIIEHYNCIINELEQEAWNNIDIEAYAADGETVPEEVYKQAREEAICEDMYYQVWKIKSLMAQNMSYEELEELVREDFETFTEEYCELENSFLIQQEVTE